MNATAISTSSLSREIWAAVSWWPWSGGVQCVGRWGHVATATTIRGPAEKIIRTTLLRSSLQYLDKSLDMRHMRHSQGDVQCHSQYYPEVYLSFSVLSSQFSVPSATPAPQPNSRSPPEPGQDTRHLPFDTWYLIFGICRCSMFQCDKNSDSSFITWSRDHVITWSPDHANI